MENSMINERQNIPRELKEKKDRIQRNPANNHLPKVK